MDLNIDYSSEVVVSLLLKGINRPDKLKESIEVYCNLVERDSVKKLE